MNTKRLTLMALMMALVIVLSSFSLTVPGGHLYLNDVVIVLAALLFNPKDALLVCGLGAFLGDFFFYPTPMFVSLVTHGLQGYVGVMFGYFLRYHTVPKQVEEIL